MEFWIRENSTPGKVKKPIAYVKGTTRNLARQRNRVATKQSYVELERVANFNTDPLVLLLAKESRTFRTKAANAIRRQDTKEIKDNGPKGRQVKVAKLYYEEGLSVAEIASLLDIPEGTVKSDLARRRERRRKLPEVANYINYRNS
jgi:DNA-directed RNA polymerase specialized sigma24 family protein